MRTYREQKRERFLADAEFRRLGEVLNGMEAEGRLPAHPAAAIRLLMLTGCRRNEIVELEWKDVDLEAGEWWPEFDRLHMELESYFEDVTDHLIEGALGSDGGVGQR